MLRKLYSPPIHDRHYTLKTLSSTYINYLHSSAHRHEIEVIKFKPTRSDPPPLTPTAHFAKCFPSIVRSLNLFSLRYSHTKSLWRIIKPTSHISLCCRASYSLVQFAMNYVYGSSEWGRRSSLQGTERTTLYILWHERDNLKRITGP